jgi:hypothetical protein
VALPFVTWWEGRPPAPYDFVVVREPTDVQDRFPTAEDLASAIADRFDEQAAQGQPRTTHATWVAVAEELGDEELDNVPSWTRYTVDDELPISRSSGKPIRLVTVIFADDPDRACVVVTATASRAEARACADLDLTR